MHNNDLEEFKKLLTSIAKYYKEPVEDFLLDIWYEGLKEFDIADLKNAFMMWIKTPSKQNAFMPKIADIISFLKGKSDDNARLAWDCVTDKVRRIGSYGSPPFDDKVIASVIHSMGGWARLCNTLDEKNIHFQEKRFIEYYKMYAEKLELNKDYLLEDKTPQKSWASSYLMEGINKGRLT